MNLEVNCIEVSQEGYLKGYAIFHSGLWDAYMVDGDNSLSQELDGRASR